jgi:ABC-type Fe3+ transport system permease subunit
MRRARAAQRPSSVSRSAKRRQTIYAVLFFVAGPLIAIGLYFTPNYKRMRGWEDSDVRYAFAYYALVAGTVAGAGAVIAMIIDPSRRAVAQQSDDGRRQEEPEPED